jgi:hypothetical protein
MTAPTLLVVHHAPNNPDLKAHVSHVVDAHKSTSTKFYTYRPMHGPTGVAYVWFPEDTAEEGALKSGSNVDASKDALKSSAMKAKSAVKGMGTDTVKTIARSKSTSGPAPFVLAVGVKAKPGKMDQLMDAGRKMASSVGGTVDFSVHTGDSVGDDSILVLFHLNKLSDLDPDGPVNSPMLAERLGADAASEIGSMMVDAVAGVWQQPLQHMPHLSVT